MFSPDGSGPEFQAHGCTMLYNMWIIQTISCMNNTVFEQYNLLKV